MSVTITVTAEHRTAYRYRWGPAFADWLIEWGKRPATSRSYFWRVLQWLNSGQDVWHWLSEIPASCITSCLPAVEAFADWVAEGAQKSLGADEAKALFPFADHVKSTLTRGRLRALGVRRNQYETAREPGRALSVVEIDEAIAQAQQKIGAGANARAIPCLLIGAYAGARLGSMLALLWRDINFETGEIRFLQAKGGRSYKTPLHPRLAAYLREQFAVRRPLPDDHVVTNIEHPGTETSRESVNRDLRKLGLSSHVGRRSLGTNLLTAGWSLQEVARMLNHRDPRTTYQHYYAPQMDSIKQKFFKAFQ